MNPQELFRQISVFGLLTLLVAAIPLVVAALYAARPSESRLALMRPFSLSALFAGLAGTLVGVVNVLMGAAATSEGARWGRVAAGVSEALVPAVFGLTCLTMAWLLVAFGMWRGVREG
jgi:biopolymer transport protein ExbB/TolQ